MDISYLLGILARRKWLILSVMLATAALTFFMIGRKPEQYKASVILATGIVNYKGLNSDNSDAFVQQYQVENAFSNLIEFVKSRSSLKILSIYMLQHDLGAENSNGQKTAFRKENQALKVTAEEKLTLFTNLSKIHLDSISDPSFSQQLDFLIDKVSRAYGYDHDAIIRSMAVKRKAETDYLTIEFTTENAQLSQFMANEYATLFLNYYTNLAVREKKKNVESYARLSAEKKAVVDTIKATKYAYLRRRGLPAIGKQSEDIIAQIADYEKSKQSAEARLNASGESMAKIDKYIGDRSSRDAREVQNRVATKNESDEQMERVRELTKKSIEAGGKNEDIEAELVEAKRDLEESVRNSARSIGRPKGTDESKRTKEDLYKDRVAYDLDRIGADKEVAQLNQRISNLRGRLSSIVADDEYATSLEADQVRAEVELDQVNADFIRAKLALEDYENPLSVIENAQLPEWPEPNRQTLISVFAAIVSGTMTIIALFLLAYLDSSLQSADLFKRYTNNLPFLGSINQIPVKNLDIKQIFESNKSDEVSIRYRENLRKIRSQILQQDAGVYLFTSTQNGEGKTFVLLSLAHSLVFNNLKVVMLDTNFKTALPEAFSGQPTPNAALLNDFIKKHNLQKVFTLKSASKPEHADEHHIDILGNTGIENSPSEQLGKEKFAAFLADLRTHYDFVLMESASLNQHSDTQELVPYADKVIAVFNAKSSIKQADKESIEYLRSLNSQFAGAILTNVDSRNMS